jgi:acyl dehydratase
VLSVGQFASAGCSIDPNGIVCKHYQAGEVMFMPKGSLYLEDLSVGMKFSAGPVRISEAEIIAFARQFDPQPFHMDPEAAKHTIFKGLVASGWHTVGVTMRLLVQGAMPFAGGSIGFGAEVSWPNPVRPGDELSVEMEIAEIAPSRSKPNQAIVTSRMTTKNQRGETVQVIIPKNLVFKRGHLPGDTA